MNWKTTASNFFAILFFIGLYGVFVPSRVNALDPIDQPVQVSASIGEARLTLFGYTAPGARVRLEGQGIFAETFADVNGYFIFKNHFLPQSERELCLTAYDDKGGSSQPSCLPPLPPKKQVLIGPIILPPIISMNQGGYAVNDFAVVHGSTVPNTGVNIKFFAADIDDNSTTGLSLPNIPTTSNNDGSFSITVPTNNDQRLRFFAQTTANDITSGKSTTLTIDIMPLWARIVSTIINMLNFLQNGALYLVITGELVFLLWFIRSKAFGAH